MIAAHRDTHFYSLKHTKVGDHIDLESADNEITRYEVTEIQVVDMVSVSFQGSDFQGSRNRRGLDASVHLDMK